MNKTETVNEATKPRKKIYYFEQYARNIRCQYDNIILDTISCSIEFPNEAITNDYKWLKNFKRSAQIHTVAIANLRYCGVAINGIKISAKNENMFYADLNKFRYGDVDVIYPVHEEKVKIIDNKTGKLVEKTKRASSVFPNVPVVSELLNKFISFAFVSEVKRLNK